MRGGSSYHRMKTLLILIALHIAAYFMAINKNTLVFSWIGQLFLFLSALIFFGAAVTCIFFPIMKPATESGVMILFTVPLGLIGLVPWMMYTTARAVINDRERTPEERKAFLKKTHKKISTDLEDQLEADTKELGKFLISAAKKRRLRENIRHSQFMLSQLKKMNHDED